MSNPGLPDDLRKAVEAVMRWKGNWSAEPYARAVLTMNFGFDDPHGVLLYLKSNLRTWKGDEAKAAKAVIDKYIKAGWPREGNPLTREEVRSLEASADENQRASMDYSPGSEMRAYHFGRRDAYRTVARVHAEHREGNPWRPRLLTVPERHQLKIACDTLKISDAMLGVAGGPSKEEARATIRRLLGRKEAEATIDWYEGGGTRGGNPIKLLTKADLKKLPPIKGQEKLGDEAVAYVKFFTPWTNWTWYMTEYDPSTGEAFGLVQGFEEELGYFSVPELETIRGPAGLRIERDLYFKPTPLSKLRRGPNPLRGRELYTLTKMHTLASRDASKSPAGSPDESFAFGRIRGYGDVRAVFQRPKDWFSKTPKEFFVERGGNPLNPEGYEGADPGFCGQCGGEPGFLGFLGDRAWFRCRNCGMEFSVRREGNPKDLHCHDPYTYCTGGPDCLCDCEGCSLSVPTRKNPEGPRARFRHERQARPTEFDPRSFRTLVRGGHRIVVGCPKHQWDIHTKRCKVGMRAQSVMHPKGERRGNPDGLPDRIANDPAFKRELAAYRKRHGGGPVKIREVEVPDGYPKYMSAWGRAPDVKYDAPGHSTKGKRVHKFGEGKGRGEKPFLVSSVEKGKKFLAYAGGKFRADGEWILD